MTEGTEGPTSRRNPTVLLPGEAKALDVHPATLITTEEAAAVIKLGRKQGTAARATE